MDNALTQTNYSLDSWDANQIPQSRTCGSLKLFEFSGINTTISKCLETGPYLYLGIDVTLQFLGRWECEQLNLIVNDNSVKILDSISKLQHFRAICSYNNYLLEDREERIGLFIKTDNKNYFNIDLRLNNSDSRQVKFGLSKIEMKLFLECPSNTLVNPNTNFCNCTSKYYSINNYNKYWCELGLCQTCFICPLFCESCQSSQNCTLCSSYHVQINGGCFPSKNSKIFKIAIYSREISFG